MRDHLTKHFQEGVIEEPELRKLIWHEDQTTRILIESIHRWRGDLVEFRPALIVKRNAFQQMRLGLNDRVGSDGRGNVNYSTIWVGSHTVFCIHGTGAGAEILATETYRELNQFGPVIRQYLGLMKWSVTEVGAVSVLEESRKGFVVPVTIGWAFQDSWILREEAPPLRSITLRTLLSC